MTYNRRGLSTPLFKRPFKVSKTLFLGNKYKENIPKKRQHTHKQYSTSIAEKKTAAPAAAEITPKIIEDWKKQYGDVFCVEAEGRKGYLRRPDRRIIASANVLGGVDGLKIKEILLRNCWLGGDSALLDEDRYFLGILPHADAIIEIVESDLKKV